MQTDIHAFSGIRTHDPSVRVGEDGSCLRQHGHCDRLIWTNILLTYSSEIVCYFQFGSSVYTTNNAIFFQYNGEKWTFAFIKIKDIELANESGNVNLLPPPATISVGIGYSRAYMQHEAFSTSIMIKVCTYIKSMVGLQNVHMSMQLTGMETHSHIHSWSWALLEKLPIVQPPQELPSILWNPKVHYRVYKSPPLVPILSQIDLIHPILSL
jgi:hypothetical protein